MQKCLLSKINIGALWDTDQSEIDQHVILSALHTSRKSISNIMSKTVCKSYIQHLAFLDATARKRFNERTLYAYFLERRKRCKSAYQQATENLPKAKTS